MSFNDIIKKSVLNSFSTAEISTLDNCIVIGVTLVLSMYIFFVYRAMNRKNFYNKNFNISLVIMALITASIIVSIQASIVVSLGMVGALSIVRFRTAVKDPMDLVYMFWALSIGIICGVGLFEVAILFTAVISIVIWGLEWIPVSQSPMILVIQGSEKNLEDEILQQVKEYAKYYKVKSRNISRGQLNLIIEIRVQNPRKLLQVMGDIEEIEHVSILDHNGETAF